MNSRLNIQQLKTFIPFGQLSDRLLEDLRRQIRVEPVLAGDLVFDVQQGDESRLFLLAGSLRFDAPEGSTVIKGAEDEESLYELLGRNRQCERIVASEDSLVLRLDADYFSRLQTWQQMMQDVLLDLEGEYLDMDWLEKLLSNPLFGKVPANNIREMLRRLQTLDMPAGSRIIEQGSQGETCYFLRTGRAQVSRECDGEEQVLAELEEGACFGEEALLSDQPRNASVSMLEDGQVLALARQDFIELLKAPVVAEIDFAKAMQQVGDYEAQWLDVRRQDEYEQAHAYGALHMPLDVLRLKSRLLNRDKAYFCYCDNGKRSQNAVFLLTQLGFKVSMLAGGTDNLTQEQRTQLLSEEGAGYLLRSNGRVEVSR